MSERSKCPTCRQPVVRAEIRTIGGNFESWHYEPVVSESPSPAPLQAAALAALVAWRKAEIAVIGAKRESWQRADRVFLAREDDLRSAADRLIAAEVAE